MNITQRDRDLGTAYAMKPSTTRTELTSVGRGTPMGELLRRYWHPVGLATDATDIPRKVRVLGEDLVLFRDKHARAGLLHARCCHRGTTLLPKAIASNSPASPTAASSRTRCASPGTPCRSCTD